MTAKPPAKTRIVDRIAGAALARYIDLVFKSSTPPPMLEENLEFLRQAHPFILAMWHGQFLLLPRLARSGIPTRVMLATHRDAEMMGEALRRFDMDLIRGAGAGIKGKDRGGANAFRAAVHALEEGFTVAMTADVPPGPARRAGAGIVMLAKVSGRPIVPVAVASRRYIALNTWSRLTINLPGTHLGASIGEVVHVPANADPEALERYRQEVEEQLNIATVDAYARAGGDPTRATPARVLAAAGLPVAPGGKLRLYRSLTSLARPLAPALLKIRERRGKEDPARRPERFGIASLPRPPGRLVWFHAASVGETNAVLPLMDALAAARPAVSLLLTTGTVTSARLAAARLRPGMVHQYVPLDAATYVAAFLEHWQPDLGVFTESEIWPNLIVEAAERGVPLAIVNARMSKASFRRWRRNGGMARPVFSRFAMVLAQNRAFALRYSELGVRTAIDVGNLKIDAPPLPVDAALLARMKRDLAGRPLWLAASTHDGEEAMVGAVHRAVKARLPGLLTLIAPRHPERGAEIATGLTAMGLDVHRRGAGEAPEAATDVYICDTLGELGTLFALVAFAFIGKSLVEGGGGHNPIEAVRHHTAVITGPSMHNFDDAYHALFAAGGAIEVKDKDELAAAVLRLGSDPAEVGRLRANAAKAFEKLAGALPKTLDALLAMLPREPADAALQQPARPPGGPRLRKDLQRAT